MTAIEFEREYYYDGPADSHSAWVWVRLLPPSGPTIRVHALLDTGASFCVFDMSLAETLGITDVTMGEEVELSLANGSPATGYIHGVSLEFLEQDFDVPAVFCPAWPEGGDNLLGMRGFSRR